MSQCACAPLPRVLRLPLSVCTLPAALTAALCPLCPPRWPSFWPGAGSPGLRCVLLAPRSPLPIRTAFAVPFHRIRHARGSLAPRTPARLLRSPRPPRLLCLLHGLRLRRACHANRTCCVHKDVRGWNHRKLFCCFLSFQAISGFPS